MDTIKGYGVIIRNTPIEEKNTVAYQELTTLGLEGNDAVIDIKHTIMKIQSGANDDLLFCICFLRIIF